METIYVNYMSQQPHISQILCGFHMLDKEKYHVVLQEKQPTPPNGIKLPAAVEVIFQGRTLIYDLDDGYQHMDGIRYLLNTCDLYFKRSFSEKKNQAFLNEYKDKMHPLGFNYHVTYKEDPLNKPPRLRQRIKALLGYKQMSCFTYDLFEYKPDGRKKPCRILFYTRLWEPSDKFPPLVNKKRETINTMRIEIIRTLREKYGRQFLGGVQKSALAKKICPDLILPYHKTDRSRYLRTLHKSDICIGTMGLHESIGWKTGEYVAAGKHYLPFASAHACVSAVDRLVNDAALREQMQKNNRDYYEAYLQPRVLVENTLRLAAQKLADI